MTGKIAIILTRPLGASIRFSKLLKKAMPKINLITSPLIKIEPTGSIPDLKLYEAVVFTSVNAVERLKRYQVPQNMTSFSVGNTTAEAARALGFSSLSNNGDINSLFQLIISKKINGSLLYLHGRYTRGNLRDRLINMGISCDSFLVYEQKAQNLSSGALRILEKKSPVILPIFSPRTAKLLIDQIDLHENMHIFAISDAVAEYFRGSSNLNITVSDFPNTNFMIKSIEKYFENQRLKM